MPFRSPSKGDLKGDLKGALKVARQGALKGALTGALQCALEGAFKGALTGALKGAHWDSLSGIPCLPHWDSLSTAFGDSFSNPLGLPFKPIGNPFQTHLQLVMQSTTAFSLFSIENNAFNCFEYIFKNTIFFTIFESSS